MISSESLQNKQILGTNDEIQDDTLSRPA